MIYFDFHTHLDKKNSCRSCTLEELQNGISLFDNKKVSLQFHPWHLKVNYDGLPEKFVEFAKSDCVYAIGEIGLDRLKGPSLEVQKAYFADLLKLADELQKPVILHVVRCADDVLHMLAGYPDLIKIWHGFRGRSELFERIVKADIFVSLHYSMLENAEFINYIKQHREYLDHIGFESDDREIEVEKLYRTFERLINE